MELIDRQSAIDIVAKHGDGIDDELFCQIIEEILELPPHWEILEWVHSYVPENQEE